MTNYHTKVVATDVSIMLPDQTYSSVAPPLGTFYNANALVQRLFHILCSDVLQEIYNKYRAKELQTLLE